MVAHPAEFPDHSCRAHAFRLFMNSGASFLVAHPLMENLPDQAAQAMSDHRQGLIVPQARQVAAIEDLEEAPFAFGGRAAGAWGGCPWGSGGCS